jgi:hypothetical protein
MKNTVSEGGSFKKILAKRTRFSLFSAGALLLSLLSSLVDGEVFEPSTSFLECEKGCRFVAGGWPFDYLVDYPWFSPAGSVSLLGALAGEDRFIILTFAANCLFWAVAIGLLWCLVRRVRH